MFNSVLLNVNKSHLPDMSPCSLNSQLLTCFVLSLYDKLSFIPIKVCLQQTKKKENEKDYLFIYCLVDVTAWLFVLQKY